VLAQIATDARSNAITAVPKLLEMLSWTGTIVTADALNRQRAIARRVVDQGGDHVLALKGNQGAPPSIGASKVCCRRTRKGSSP
jgi:predicted transposase YbfD/YdcC